MDGSWLEVSLETDGEAAEAVSEVFNRLGRGGAVVEVTYPPDSPYHEDVQPSVRIKTYLSVDDAETKRQIEEAIWYLGRLYPMPDPTFEVLTEDDWANAWKKSYQPLRIGRHLVVVPSWCTFTPEPGDVLIELDPGMAFGTGLHPTTRGCLAALEKYAAVGQVVLDMGAGSGILSIAAANLGVGSVLAIEKDPLAAKIAAENVALNGVAQIVSVETGSLEKVTGTFDLLLVNILADVIVSLVEDGLLSHLKGEGHFIASGIIERLEPQVLTALEARQATVIERFEENDWITLVGTVGPAPCTPETARG